MSIRTALATIIKGIVPSFGWPVLGRGGGWYPVIREAFAGAWQRNITFDRRDELMGNSVIYACTTRIANDIAKLPVNLVEFKQGIWKVVEENSPYWPVLRKPNKYQNRIQFYVCWMLSKLMYGNTYVLLIRDERRIPIAMHVLNPCRVRPAIGPDGSVWYELAMDELAGITGRMGLPASEIIHDLMNPLFHPLCGIPPLFAAALTATQQGRAQHFAAKFYENMSRPGGLLSFPSELTKEKMLEYKEILESGFSGENLGRIMVTGGGAKFDAIGYPAQQSQLVEGLRWGVEDIARPYQMPLHKIGAGPVPTSNNVEALNQQYYDDCLQPHFEQIELCLDEGLGLTDVTGRPRWTFGTEFDLDNLLRMDSATHITSLAAGTGAGIYSINEARLKRNLPPADGGEEPILQQQNWPLSQIASRELPERPQLGNEPPSSQEAGPTPGTPAGPDTDAEDAKALVDAVLAKFYAKSIEKALADG